MAHPDGDRVTLSQAELEAAWKEFHHDLMADFSKEVEAHADQLNAVEDAKPSTDATEHDDEVLNSLGSDPETALEASLIALAKEAKERKDSPDYGQMFFRSQTREVWYVSADGDDRMKWLEDALTDLVGEDKWTIEAESFPRRNDGWIQLFPTRKKW